MKNFTFLILLAILFANVVHAHGLVTTQAQAVGDYTLEFEYNTIGNIQAGDLTTFDVYLLDKNKNPLDFDGVYINISKPGMSPALVANLLEAPDFRGSARVSALIKDPGDYIATIHFESKNQVFAKADFRFQVDDTTASQPAPAGSSKKVFILALGIGMIIGFVFGFSLKTKK